MKGGYGASRAPKDGTIVCGLSSVITQNRERLVVRISWCDATRIQRSSVLDERGSYGSRMHRVRCTYGESSTGERDREAVHVRGEATGNLN